MLLQGTTEYRKDTKEAMMLELMPDLDAMKKEKSPKILNTHLPFRWLPKKHADNGWKIVHVRRNPKDVLVSTYHHIQTQGGMGGMEADVSWDEFFDTYINGYCMKTLIIFS